MAMDLNKPAQVQRAEDFGMLLYELHKTNLKCFDVPGHVVMRDWEEISDIAKEAWTATATMFLQQFSED